MAALGMKPTTACIIPHVEWVLHAVVVTVFSVRIPRPLQNPTFMVGCHMNMLNPRCTDVTVVVYGLFFFWTFLLQMQKYLSRHTSLSSLKNKWRSFHSIIFQHVSGFRVEVDSISLISQVFWCIIWARWYFRSFLTSENACCHSVQNLLSFSWLSPNINIKIHRIIIVPVVLYGCETWSLTLR
jgi:hypothetical protein